MKLPAENEHRFGGGRRWRMTSPTVPSDPRYDGIAQWYEERFRAYSDLREQTSSSNQLVELLGPGTGVCLDIACGGGLHHAAIASTGRTIVGIDLSADQLGVARRRGLAMLARADAVALPFADGSFATAVCTYLHTDIDDIAPAFTEIRRVLKPGGTFVYLGVHPCFWGHFVELPGATERILHPGYLTTGWVPCPYLRDQEGLRAKVGARHVTVSEFVNAVVAAGLTLRCLAEPGPSPDGHADRIAIVASGA